MNLAGNRPNTLIFPSVKKPLSMPASTGATGKQPSKRQKPSAKPRGGDLRGHNTISNGPERWNFRGAA
nr:MAG TPA: hypothetical protein [Caudoviricetes sp.]